MKALSIVQRFYPDVKRVKDASSSLRIEVTTKDTQSPGVKQHKDCALAVACKKMNEVDGAIVSISTAYLIKGDVAIRYRIPVSVAREIVSFDRRGGFEPGEYYLDPKFHKLGAPAGTGSSNRAKKGKVKGFKRVTHGIRTDLRVKAE